MAGTFHLDDISINTIVGAGSSVKGNFFSEGFTRIDGDIDGKLEVDGRVIIGAGARIKGDLIASSANIYGVVNGDILAPESVHIFSKAMVLGDVVTKKLCVEEDVLLHGQCISLSNNENFLQEQKRWLDKKAITGKTFQLHNSD